MKVKIHNCGLVCCDAMKFGRWSLLRGNCRQRVTSRRW